MLVLVIPVSNGGDATFSRGYLEEDLLISPLRAWRNNDTAAEKTIGLALMASFQLCY